MKKLFILTMSLGLSLTALAEKLYVGTNAEYVPYEYLENGKLVGFDVELMELIGEKAGYEIVWKDMSFDGLLPALQTKKVDAVIAGMAASDERKKAVDFSNPYLYFESEHLVITNVKSGLNTKEELKDKIVGAQLGSIQEGFAKNLGAKVRPYNSFLGALMDLQNNKIDGVIIAKKTGDEYMQTLKGLKVIGSIIDKTPGESIAFRKGDTEKVEKVNKVLDELKDSPEYIELQKKYFPEHFQN